MDGKCIWCDAPANQKKMIKGFTCNYTSDGKKSVKYIYGKDFLCNNGDCIDLTIKFDTQIENDMMVAYLKY